jgi:hypothetical protein
MGGMPLLTAVSDRQVLGVVHADNTVKGAQLDVVLEIVLGAEDVGGHFVLVDEVDHVVAGEDIPEEVISGVAVSFSLLRGGALLGLRRTAVRGSGGWRAGLGLARCRGQAQLGGLGTS